MALVPEWTNARVVASKCGRLPGGEAPIKAKRGQMLSLPSSLWAQRSWEWNRGAENLAEALSRSLSMLSTKRLLGSAKMAGLPTFQDVPGPSLGWSWPPGGFCRVSTNMGVYDLGYFFASFDFVLIFILLGVGGMWTMALDSQESVLAFHHMNLRDWIRVINFGGRDITRWAILLAPFLCFLMSNTDLESHGIRITISRNQVHNQHLLSVYYCTFRMG